MAGSRRPTGSPEDEYYPPIPPDASESYHGYPGQGYRPTGPHRPQEYEGYEQAEGYEPQPEAPPYGYADPGYADPGYADPGYTEPAYAEPPPARRRTYPPGTRTLPPQPYPRAPEYDDVREPSRRVPYATVILVSALVSVVTVVALYLVMETVTHGGKVSVPALVGLSVHQAQITAQNVKLNIHLAGNVADPVIEKGKVAQQNPLPGSTLEPGGQVIITLSSGPSRTTLPSLENQTLARAMEQLRKLGLEPGSTSYRSSDTVAEGLVVTTVPPPGSLVAAGSQVAIVLAQAAAPSQPAPAPAQAPALPLQDPSGSQMVQVPRVTGVRVQFATSRLRSRGLQQGRITYAKDEDHMEDYVLSQSPAPGTLLRRGQGVDLVVNRFN